MAADADNVELADSVNALHLSDPDSDCQSIGDQTDEYDKNWGFRLSPLFKLCLAFYKDQDGKVIHLSYEDKLKLVSYHKQATQGKYKVDASPDVGFLDFVGSNRRKAWQALGDMSKSEAKAKFVSLIDTNSSQFRPFIEAHKVEREEEERRKKEAEEQKRREIEERERKEREEKLRENQEMELHRQQETERQIREALNQQTAVQFQQFAEQQCPDDVEKQRELMSQLQEQHFQQYMQQVYQQQLLHQQQQKQQLEMGQQKGGEAASTANHVDGDHGGHDGELRHDLVTAEEDSMPPIAAARIWTNKNPKEFKEVLKNEKESVIKVGSGETVTIRVPTHEDGNCLFWEFCTDHYDVGFGVYFEWTIPPSNEVSVHVSESSEEDEMDEDAPERVDEVRGDLESGKKRKEPLVPTDEIIPVYRRDSHEEVYCGSHTYPGRGVYLLKFDNSYSLWRSKTLYYRVYFTK